MAKQKHNAFLGTATGKTLLKRLVFENNREGFEKLLMHVESISASNGHKRVTFGLEPTADYHKPLAEFLINREHNLVSQIMQLKTRMSHCGMIFNIYNTICALTSFEGGSGIKNSESIASVFMKC